MEFQASNTNLRIITLDPMFVSTYSDPGPLLADLATLDLSGDVKPPTFHLFGSLSPELRTKIWRLAAPKPAVIERSPNNTTMSYGLRRRVPALLHVCRESRAELLYESKDRRGSRDEQYEMLYLSRGLQAQGHGVYMNYRNDTLFMYRGPSQSIMPDAANFANLQNLAMEWGLRPCWVQNHCHEGVRLIRQFPQLKTLTLLVSFKIYNELPLGESGSKHREQTQKRRALREIKSWVVGAMDQARESDENARGAANDASASTSARMSQEPVWNPPEVRVVPKTKYWSVPSWAA
ncbi:hypothetical protein CORC01_12600 [Colletotrichum orchidophilum]|uniref:2EXR domain-containing protein n=1 Tax=Colletotrichum orchidophilum TaxID=1209926 RepID=A0A1G4ASJ5_9PEZI|nr:uncharacterized protein CORC01_12600 [Colletotrichum orchidophilum]OHE92085.1 hypothetical protein CORC01_12600 [Colletotrichum orchidophilum]